MASQPQAGLFTVLGQRYGHPRFGRDPKLEENVSVDHTVLASLPPLKSGLTPLEPPVGDALDQEFRTYHIQTGYQRDRFKFFTTKELDSSGAWAPTRDGDAYDILPQSTPIHPLFQKSRWEVTALPLHEAQLPLYQCRDGFFTTKNNIVWNAMLPALRLASMYMTHPQTLQWWYALLFGEYSDIPNDELDFGTEDEAQYKSIKFWSPEYEAKSYPDIFNEIQQKFRDLSTDIEYHLASGNVSIYSGTRAKVLYSDGLTTHCMSSTNITAIRANIATELVEPLLSNQLTMAERMITIHGLALTIVHETAHACWKLTFQEHGSKEASEPLFADELYCELGFSMQNAIFGGIHEGYMPEIETISKGLPQVGYNEVPWNSELTEGIAVSPKRKMKATSFNTHFPIDLDSFFFEQQEAFWQYFIPKFGPQGAYLQKAPIGLEIDLATGGTKGQVVFDPETPRSLNRVVVNNSKMSTADIYNAKLENTRRQRAKDIYTQLQLDSANATWIRKPPNSAYESLPENKPRPDPNKKLPDPAWPRFREIVNYCISTRDVHFWDTFHFETPEHVLYNHIRRHGVLSISPEEWRDFLILCNNNDGLFHYDYIGGPPTPHLGFVRRNPKGWPTTPIALTHLQPTALEEFCFVEGMKKFGKFGRFLNFFRIEDWNDLDKEIMRNEINACLSIKRIKYQDKKITGNLTALAFDKCIAECQRTSDDSWCFGHPGIIRKNEFWDRSTWE